MIPIMDSLEMPLFHKVKSLPLQRLSFTHSLFKNCDKNSNKMPLSDLLTFNLSCHLHIKETDRLCTQYWIYNAAMLIDSAHVSFQGTLARTDTKVIVYTELFKATTISSHFIILKKRESFKME